MKPVFFFLLVLLLTPAAPCAADDDLQACHAELRRALRSGNADSLAYAYCHLGEYYAYRDADSARHYCLQGLEHADHGRPEPYLILLNNLAETYVIAGDLPTCIRLFRQADVEARRLRYDEEGFRREVDLIVRMGFDGKSLINPKQIAYVHERLAPTPKQIAHSEKIVRSCREQADAGVGVYVVDGKMVDPPFFKEAERIIELAKKCGVYHGDL